jgi:FSR family fosmidomycin resistance protein-like MFS transporter
MISLKIKEQQRNDITATLAPEEINKQETIYKVLFAISITHLLNDMIQSTIPAVYPILKENYTLTFTQIGFITLAFQMTASILQPFIGHYTDKRPNPRSLAIGMAFSMMGLLSLAFAHSFFVILVSVSMIGLGSSIFHPEASRVAHLASGGKKGLAQSIFQVGGNSGSAIGPLLAALIVLPHGQPYLSVFGIGAIIGIVILWKIGSWYQRKISSGTATILKKASGSHLTVSRKRIFYSLLILLALVFSKYFYMACLTNYFTFFLIDKFHVSIQQSQIYLFVFLAAVAAGTILGGPLGDKYGRKNIIWASILGAAPFTLALPYVNLFWTIVLAVIIGLIISSAFSAILVYATDLVPGKVGLIAGLFFGLSFGLGGIGSAVLGVLADHTSINFVFKVCAYLPLLGIITGLFPDLRKAR